jgi:hypothetical protein
MSIPLSLREPFIILLSTGIVFVIPWFREIFFSRRDVPMPVVKKREPFFDVVRGVADPNYKPSDDPEYQGAKKVVKQLYNKVDPTQIVQLIKKSECMDLIALALQGTAKTHPERLDENGQPTPAGVLWLMETVQHAVDGP